MTVPLPAGSSDDLQLAVKAALTAGELIRERFHAQPSTIQLKDGKGEVTETDLAAEAAIFEVLSGSSHGVLSEEAGGDPVGDLWIIDPVDGTTNFSRRLPLCAVSIGLRLGGQLSLGVIYHPVTEELYLAERGLGAWRNQQRLHVAATADPSLAVIYLTHGYAAEHRTRYGEALSRFAATSYPRTFGSTAVELSFVAAGSGDAWVCSGDELWDFAAGMVLVEEAGGRVSDWHGRDWDGESTYTIVSNGAIHEFLLDTVRDLQPGS
jgi:myo-inositol-1(or 4)-monophosphatase